MRRFRASLPLWIPAFAGMTTSVAAFAGMTEVTVAFCQSQNGNPGALIRIDSPFENSAGEGGLQLDFEAQRACLDGVEGYFVELVFLDGEG